LRPPPKKNSGWVLDTPAMAGYPRNTAPAGYVNGLPVALSFFGSAYSDAELLGFAYAFEFLLPIQPP